MLTFFDAGLLRVESEGTGQRISYSLRTVRSMLIVTAMVAIPTTLVAFNDRKSANTALLIFVLGWLWLFGVNYLIAMFRFPSWLKRGLARH